MSESAGENSKSYTYKDSGVDIDKTNRMLSGLKKVIRSTHDKNVLSDLLSFCGLFNLDVSKYKNPVLVSSTDGVGTKVMLAREMKDYSTIGQDLVAMSINDLICCGAKPLFFLDYIACRKIDIIEISAVITSISNACRFCNTALLGGETAEHPEKSEEGEIDLAGFAVGIVEKEKIFTSRNVKRGDIVIGLKSSGLHSNGFSMVRKLITSAGFNLEKPLKWTQGENLGQALLTPTRLYSPLIGHLLDDENIDIKAVANITGGGFYQNIDRIINKNMDVVIRKGKWDIPPVFDFLQKLGDIPEKEMYKVFNMGIGMVLVTSPESMEALHVAAGQKDEEVVRLGEVTGGIGSVLIKGIDI